MFILFELSSSKNGLNAPIECWDCMGTADTEEEAMHWVGLNAEYRTYKYCPKEKYKIV